MGSLKWTIDTDAFEDVTPVLGKLAFENIIATLNPNAERFLVLACHYDSKYFPNQEFLGASDSAVPCAMLIDLAIVMARFLDQNRFNDELSLQLLFLDGEEAFKEWSNTDSIYGARHLAARWEEEDVLKKIVSWDWLCIPFSIWCFNLQDLFVLLDLLGLPDPTFYSFFGETEHWHSHMINVEQRIAQTGQMPNYENSGITNRIAKGYFQDQAIRSGIEDDHIPFLHRGVPILHVIPLPFPDEWHTMQDDWHAVDFTTTENLNRILRVFVAEYLHLNLNI